MTDLCVLIVPSQHLCTRIDSGVSNFEKVLREIPSAKLSVTVPTLVIGLFDVDDDGVFVEDWNVKDLCVDLDIVKGSKKETHEAHTKLILEYINKLKDVLIIDDK